MKYRRRLDTRKGLFSIGIVILVCMLVSPVQTFGWGNTWNGINLEKIVNSSLWRIGALRCNATFWLYNSGYDSNIFYGNLQEPISDFTFSAGSNITLYMPFKSGIVFEINETPQYGFYLHNKEDMGFSNSFSSQVHFALKKLYFRIGGGYINIKERVTTELYINVRRRENDFNGMAFWQISKRSALSLEYIFSSREYENPEVLVENPGEFIINWETLNRNESYLNLIAYLQNSPKTRLYMNAEYGAFTFKEDFSSFKDSRSYGVFGGIEFLPSPSSREGAKGIRGNIELGYKLFNVDSPDQKDYGGLVGNTAVSIDINRFTKISGTFLRDVQFSVYGGQAYFLQTVYTGGITHSLSEKITVTYALSLSRNQYVRQETIDKFLSHSIRLGFRLTERIELNLIANISERNPNSLEIGKHRNFFGLNFKYGMGDSSDI